MQRLEGGYLCGTTYIYVVRRQRVNSNCVFLLVIFQNNKNARYMYWNKLLRGFLCVFLKLFPLISLGHVTNWANFLIRCVKIVEHTSYRDQFKSQNCLPLPYNPALSQARMSTCCLLGTCVTDFSELDFSYTLIDATVMYPVSSKPKSLFHD